MRIEEVALALVLVVGCRGDDAQTERSRAAYMAMYDDEHRRAEEESARRKAEAKRQADSETARRAQDAENERLAVVARRDAEAFEKARAEREKLALSCAADREARTRMRIQLEKLRARDAAEQQIRQAELAYRKSHCTLDSRGVSVPGDAVEWDDDGYLRRTRDVAWEVTWVCPANGPVGSRGRIQAGYAHGGDPSRIARIFTPTRDERCREADAEAVDGGVSP